MRIFLFSRTCIENTEGNNQSIYVLNKNTVVSFIDPNAGTLREGSVNTLQVIKLRQYFVKSLEIGTSMN
jgi:hypothetical protein